MARGKADFAKLLAKANALIAQNGVDLATVEQADGQGTNYRSEDAVLVFVNHPPHFIPGKCRNCGKHYAVNKKSVGFCSNDCRKEDWRRTMHIPYAAVSPRDVWDGDPPMIVTPAQYETLEKVARWFIQNQTVLEIQDLGELGPSRILPEGPLGLSTPLGEIPPSIQEGRNHQFPPPSETFDLFEEEVQTDRSEVYPPTNHLSSQYQSTLEQTTEEENVFDFD